MHGIGGRGMRTMPRWRAVAAACAVALAAAGPAAAVDTQRIDLESGPDRVLVCGSFFTVAGVLSAWERDASEGAP